MSYNLKKRIIGKLLSKNGRYEIVESLLEQSDGDVDSAILLSQKCCNDYRTPGDSLGNFGFCGPGMSYRITGSAPANNVMVWMPDSSITSSPDFEITWREVFEYVLYDSNLLTRQMRLFQHQ